MNPPSRSRPAHVLLWSMAGLTAITWVRVIWVRTLAVDYTGGPLSWVVLGAAWLAFSAAAMRSFLGALDGPPSPLPRLFAVAVALHAVAALALPYSSNDLYSNLAYGRMARLGLDPYSAGPVALPAGDPFRALVSRNWIHAPSAYGPILTWLNALAGRAPTVPAAMAAFKLTMLAVTLATVAIAYAICKRHLRPAEAAPAFVLFAWNPLLAYEISGQAHNDAVMLLGLTAFVWAALARRQLLAVLFLSLAFYAKFAVAPVLGLYLWTLARTDRARAAAGAALVVAIGVLLFLPFWHGPATLLGPLATVRANHLRVTRSFTEIAYLVASLAGERAGVWAYRVGWGLGMALLAALAVRAVRRVTTVESVLHESLVYLAFYLLLAAPFVLPWYLSWLLPLTLTERDPRWRRLVALYTGLSVVEWCADVPPLQAAAVNGTILVLMVRWWRTPGAAAARVADPPAAASG